MPMGENPEPSTTPSATSPVDRVVDGIRIPREATEWRVRRILANGSFEPLSYGTLDNGQEIRLFPVEEFSLNEIVRRWGAGRFAFNFSARQPNNRIKLLGAWSPVYQIGPVGELPAPPALPPGPYAPPSPHGAPAGGGQNAPYSVGSNVIPLPSRMDAPVLAAGAQSAIHRPLNDAAWMARVVAEYGQQMAAYHHRELLESMRTFAPLAPQHAPPPPPPQGSQLPAVLAAIAPLVPPILDYMQGQRDARNAELQGLREQVAELVRAQNAILEAEEEEPATPVGPQSTMEMLFSAFQSLDDASKKQAFEKMMELPSSLRDGFLRAFNAK